MLSNQILNIIIHLIAVAVIIIFFANTYSWTWNTSPISHIKHSLSPSIFHWSVSSFLNSRFIGNKQCTWLLFSIASFLDSITTHSCKNKSGHTSQKHHHRPKIIHQFLLILICSIIRNFCFWHRLYCSWQIVIDLVCRLFIVVFNNFWCLFFLCLRKWSFFNCAKTNLFVVHIIDRVIIFQKRITQNKLLSCIENSQLTFKIFLNRSLSTISILHKQLIIILIFPTFKINQ